jgi:hypothetical protein
MAHIDGEKTPPPVVQALQSTIAVVSYRAVVGALCLALTSMVGYYGNSIMAAQKELSALVGNERVNIAENKGRIDNQNDRIGRMESSVVTISQKDGELDHRVTVLETRQGR